MFRTNAKFHRFAALGSAALLAAGLSAVTAPAHAATATYKVLVFSKTTGFRHDSIPAGITAIQNLGVQNGFAVDATEDDTLFTDTNLAQYKTVIFLNATGDPVSTQAEKDSFQRYIQAGGGYVGVHAAADSGYTWGFYGGLVGAYFQQHPAIQAATVRTEDTTHPATATLPRSFTRTDEWYDFQTNPRSSVHVLTNVDDNAYTGSVMGADHPNTWCKNFNGGRSFYTAWGHTIASYTEANFLTLLLGGITWTAGQTAGDCSIPATTTPVISLRSHANNQFVSSDTAGTVPLIANSTTNGTNQQFDQVDAGNGMIALRAHANNMYVTAENAGASSLIANRTAIGAWEMFTLIRNADGSVSFRANANGKLVTAENAGASALIANRTAVGLWEEFDLITAAAAPVPFNLKGTGSGRCVDVPNGVKGTQLQVYDCSTTNPNQRLTYTAASELQVLGFCIGAVNGGTTNGTAAVTGDCNGSTAQKWTFQADGTVSNNASGLKLDVSAYGTANGSLVQIWSHTGATNQLWTRI